jgi:hypothetical protein
MRAQFARLRGAERGSVGEGDRAGGLWRAARLTKRTVEGHFVRRAVFWAAYSVKYPANPAQNKRGG